MDIKLNGEVRQINEGITITQLLEQLAIENRNLAVEYNSEFMEEDAFQCGYCTPGQVMNVEGLLRKTPDPTMEQIREGVSGNLCRCGAYVHIFRAAQRAAELKKAAR